MILGLLLLMGTVYTMIQTAYFLTVQKKMRLQIVDLQASRDHFKERLTRLSHIDYVVTGASDYPSYSGNQMSLKTRVEILESWKKASDADVQGLFEYLGVVWTPALAAKVVKKQYGA